MTVKTVQLHNQATARPGTFDGSVWTFLLMSHKVLQHHLDLASLVSKLALVLDLFNKSSSQTVGHVGWHRLSAGGAIVHSGLAWTTNDVAGGTTWDWKLSRNVEAHGALQVRLNPGHRVGFGLITVLA